MKTSNFLRYMFIWLPALMISCADKTVPVPEPQPEPQPDEDDKIEINFVSQAPVFPDKKGQQEVEFNASGDWTATTDQEWCSVTPGSGASGVHTLQVKVDENISPFERNAAVIVAVKDVKKSMTVSQKQHDALLLSSAKAEISGEAQMVDVELSTNLDYTYSIDEKAQEWISESRSRAWEKKKHQFQVNKNESTSAREGKIVFMAGEFKETFTIYQQPGEDPQLVLSQKEFVVSYEQSDIAIELQSNTEFKMILPEVGWIHEAESRAMSTYTKHIKVDVNEGTDERTADILFLYGDKVEKVSIFQKPADAIILAKNDYTVGVEKNDLYFVVAANVEYQTTCSVDWIQLVPSSRAMSVDELHFVIDGNASDEQRTGEILFKSTDAEQKVTIIQSGKAGDGLAILSEAKVFDANGGKQEILIAAGIDWKVESLESWCKVSPMSGSAGHHNVTISVDENTGYDERNTGVVFTYGDKKQIITIVQKQKDALLLSSAKADVAVEGGDVSFEVKTNVQCSVSIDEDGADWVTAVSSRALRSETYLFKVAPNTGFKTREASIRITGNGLMEIFKIYQACNQEPTFVLTQKEYYLDANVNEFTVELKTNKEYKVILPTDSWVHENKSRSVSTYTHYFSVDKNTSNEDRKTSIQFVTDGKTETIWVYQSVKAFQAKCTIKIEFMGFTAKTPLLTGTKDVSGTITWDWNSTETYAPNLMHTYNSEVLHNIQIETENVENIHFDNIDEIRHINIIEME